MASKFFSLVIVLSAMACLTAHASYFQTTCSNATGAIKYSSGHDDNSFVVITEEGAGTWSSVNLIIERDEIMEVSEEKGMSCPPGGGKSGYAWGRITSLVDLKVSRRGGSAFPTDALIPGLSEDGKTIEATLLCEDYHDGEVLCDDSNSN